MIIQDQFPLGLTGLIPLHSKGLSRVFSNTSVQKHVARCWALARHAPVAGGGCVWNPRVFADDARAGAVAQSPGREAALAWASLAQRSPASSVLARDGAGCGSPIFPAGCEGEGKLGVALESLQGLRDLT